MTWAGLKAGKLEEIAHRYAAGSAIAWQRAEARAPNDQEEVKAIFASMCKGLRAGAANELVELGCPEDQIVPTLRAILTRATQIAAISTSEGTA